MSQRSEAEEARTERCGECRALIPGGEPSVQSTSHEGFCSLHPDNEYDRGDDLDLPLVVHGGLGALLAAIDACGDLNGSELDDAVAEAKGDERAEINNGGVHAQVRYLVSVGVHPSHLATLLNVEIGK